MKLENGDLLESKFCDYIRSNIPAYEDIWGRYIGHDGYGKMITISHLSNDGSSKRTNFAEFNYTVLESILCMKLISEKALLITDIDSYLETMNYFISFQSHAGRIRDNVKGMLNLIIPEKSNELLQLLEDFYQQRNNILHGRKLPIRLEEGLILIPAIQGNEEHSNKWNSKMKWEEIVQTDLRFISDYLVETLQETCSKVNSIFYNLVEPIKKIIDTNKIEIPEFGETNKVQSAIPSASAYFYNYGKNPSGTTIQNS